MNPQSFATDFTWNLFLALVPIALAHVFQALVPLPRAPGRRHAAVAALVATGTLWLAFVPNTCYLLTEWRHFRSLVAFTTATGRWRADPDTAAALMGYSLFYAVYGCLGALTFTLALRPVTRTLRRAGHSPWGWAPPFFLLMALGVYLGLRLRYNTWDLWLRPAQVWSASVAVLSRPVLVLYHGVFAGSLALIYLLTDIWVEGFLCRRERWRSREGRNP